MEDVDVQGVEMRRATAAKVEEKGRERCRKMICAKQLVAWSEPTLVSFSPRQLP